MGASSWVLLQGWALQGGKETAETEGGTSQAGRMELWENIIVMCSSLKKHFMNPSDVPRCSPPRITVLRGWAAPERELYPLSLLPSSPDPGDIWHYLETILIVTTVSGVDAPSIKLVEARGQAVHPTMHRKPPRGKNYLASKHQ